MIALFSSPLLAEELHDIVPPMNYSLIPAWMVFLAVALGLFLIGGIVWLMVRAFKRRAIPPLLPKERALAALARRL